MTDLEAILLAGVEFDTNGWGCWLWAGELHSAGYGHVRAGKRLTLAHRAAFRLWVGPIPAERPLVCHHCDVRPCIRPDHLFAGTNEDNMLDAVNKRRVPAILQPADIPVIRARLAAGELQRVIAADYGVTHWAISSISIGRTWRHIK